MVNSCGSNANYEEIPCRGGRLVRPGREATVSGIGESEGSRPHRSPCSRGRTRRPSLHRLCRSRAWTHYGPFCRREKSRPRSATVCTRMAADCSSL